MRGKRAIVVGGGIGGPVVAMALQRAGMEPEIHEARTANADELGSFLNTASNGLDALRALGAERGVVEQGFPTPRMTMWSGTGKRLGEVDNGLALGGGTVSTTIERGQLHRVLREEALARGIPLHRGKRLVDAEARDGAVVARFDDGTHATADILVGADGLHSRTRRIIDPHAPAPRYTGQLSLGGIARATGWEPTPGAYHMIFGRRAFFGYSVTPRGDAYWFANVAEPREPSRAELAAIAPRAWKDRLVDIFAGDEGPAVAMIQATHTEVAAWPIHDMPVVPVWHRGGMVLVGDAAHATSPSSGQGAAMAMEDAIVLAKCLRDLDDAGAAFAAYERIRRERVERVVRYSARVGSTKVPGAIGRFFRDLMMPIALRLFASSSAHAWLYRHHIEWNEAVAS